MFFVRTNTYHFLCSTVEKVCGSYRNYGPDGKTWKGDGRLAHPFVSLEEARKVAEKYNAIVCDKNAKEIVFKH